MEEANYVMHWGWLPLGVLIGGTVGYLLGAAKRDKKKKIKGLSDKVVQSEKSMLESESNETLELSPSPKLKDDPIEVRIARSYLDEKEWRERDHTPF